MIEKLDIFSKSILDQPNKNDYLWRYIKAEHVESSLKGSLYFSQLSKFDDYFETISPLHYILLRLVRKAQNTQVTNTSINIRTISEYLQISKQRYESLHLKNQIREIIGSDDETLISKVLQESLNSISDIAQKHWINQETTLCSCWFIGDRNESANMWNNYSNHGGIAIRIHFKNFMRLIDTYFESRLEHESLSGFNSIIGGKIKYRNFHEDVTWLAEVKNLSPLAFFKHISYSHENEYRLVVDGVTSTKQFPQSHQPFTGLGLTSFDIILHPTATYEDELKLKHNFQLARIQQSELIWTKKTD